MRRAWSLLLALLLGWPMLGPALPAATADTAPHACCRRAQHRCGGQPPAQSENVVRDASSCNHCCCVLGGRHSPALTPISAALHAHAAQPLAAGPAFDTPAHRSDSLQSVRAPPSLPAI